MGFGGDWTSQDYCYLITRGRRTGRPHTVEIWFAASDDETTLWLLAGGGTATDWVRNGLASPGVGVRIGGQTLTAGFRLTQAFHDEDAALRPALAAKYQSWQEGLPLSEWAGTSLGVALDLDPWADEPR